MLLWTAALYNLNRANQPFAVGNGFFIPNGVTHTRGFEPVLNGYVTADWQSILGYAYTYAGRLPVAPFFMW